MTPQQEPIREGQGKASPTTPRKPYSKPEIILELELETRAGSPLGLDPFDPFDLEPKE